jgi:hypothetical protein
MGYLDESSLARTVEAVAEAQFYGWKITSAELLRALRFIASRQGLPGAYAGLFAPVEGEETKRLQLFTGEWVQSQAATLHILGEEAYRVLARGLPAGAAGVKALKQAPLIMQPRLEASDLRGPGMYCCGTCSVAVWRAIGAGGYPGLAGYHEQGMRSLRAARSGDGRWRRFPFWYTLLALTELDPALARAELRYAAPAVKRALKRVSADGAISERRRRVGAHALDCC